MLRDAASAMSGIEKAIGYPGSRMDSQPEHDDRYVVLWESTLESNYQDSLSAIL